MRKEEKKGNRKERKRKSCGKTGVEVMIRM